MLKQRTMGAIALIGLGAATAAPATAEVQPGWYVGLSPGQSSYDISKDELDEIVIDAFASAGAPVTSGSSSLDDSDTAWAVFGGYRFNPYIAVEAGYVDLGSAEYRSSGTVNPPGPATSAPAGASMDFSASGFTIGGVGSLPLGEMFDVHARFGIFFSEMDIDIGTVFNTASVSDTLSGSSEDLYFGVGAALHVGTNWSFSADWQRYADVGDAEESGEGDIDALSLSVMFRF